MKKRKRRRVRGKFRLRVRKRERLMNSKIVVEGRENVRGRAGVSDKGEEAVVNE